MPDRLLRAALLLIGLAAVAVVLTLIMRRLGEDGDATPRQRGERPPTAVQAADIRRGPIADRRRFSGELRASASFAVAPRVSGLLRSISVEPGDRISSGQVIARLDDADQAAAVATAEAAVAVAKARLAEAEAAVPQSRRDAERMQALASRAVAAESEREAAEAVLRSREAAVAVAAAQLTAAQAQLATARLDLAACVIAPHWDGDDERVIGERLLDAGGRVSAQAPLATVLAIDPLLAVIHVTEDAYPRLQPGQAAQLRTAAWPGESFPATVTRLAPRFAAGSRQAAVELTVPNAESRLKPGMFIRASIALTEVAEAVLVPEAALASRDGKDVVFVLDTSGTTVRLVAVRPGLREDGLVQVDGEGLHGRVVTLGQQNLKDGSRVSVPASKDSAP